METSRTQLADFPVLQVSTAAAWLPTPGRTAAKLLDRWGLGEGEGIPGGFCLSPASPQPLPPCTSPSTHRP